MSLGRVDRYDLLALIGEGSFGGVYRARHIHTGQVHALKLARDAVDPEGAARMLAEARAAASLRHPHVVGIIDSGVAATGETFLVMELLEGSTLARLLEKEGPLAPVRANRIARQMLDGLAAAHANGIATHFEMLTMRPPIVADSFETWMQKLRSEPTPLLGSVAPNVPAALAAVVDRALARDPDARWPSAAAMRDALDLTVTATKDGFSPTILDAPPLASAPPLHASTAPPYASAPPPYPSTPPPYASAPPPYASAPPPYATYPSGPPPLAPTLPMPSPQPAYSYPPPQVAPQTSSGGSLVPWLVGALVLVVVLIGVVGIGALFFFTRSSAETATATAPTAAPPAPAAPNGGPTPAATSTTAPGARGGPASPAANPPKLGVAPVPGPAPAPATPDAPAKVAGAVRISAPQIVGDLRQDAFMTLAGRARPAVEQCNPDRRPLVVKVDVMIGNKKITIAQPSVNTNPGDPLIARCVAQSLKDAQFPGFAPGDSGIYKEAQFSWQ